MRRNERVADAIESVGIGDTLYDRIRTLEADGNELDAAITGAENAKPSLNALPGILFRV